MAIDEAIKHAEEVASRLFDDRVHCIKCAEEHRQLAKLLKELKQYREQTQWIPVSERLPEENGGYLITWTTSLSKRPFIGISEGEVTSEYDHEFEWLLEDYIKNYPDVKVIAWMPLPEPYKESEG